MFLVRSAKGWFPNGRRDKESTLPRLFGPQLYTLTLGPQVTHEAIAQTH